MSDLFSISALLSCNPESGVLTWKVNRGSARIGDVAGTLNGKGYWQVQIKGKLYLAHRLIWLYVHGHWPANELDHINGIGSDNRIANLREATRSENQCNHKLNRNNSSGVKGVHWDKSRKKWFAQCVHLKRTYFIGLFGDLSAADAAVRDFREKLHGEFCNHGHQVINGG